MKTHLLQIRVVPMQGFILTILLTFWGAWVSAQCDLLYQTTSDQVSWTRATSVAGDGAGNTFMAGEFENTLVLGSFVLTNIPLSGGYIVDATAFIGKYNSDTDTWLWATKIALVPYAQGSTQALGNSFLTDMTRDNSGNLYITGTYLGTVKFDNITLVSTKQGTYPTVDIYVAKINANGNFVWARSLGSKNGGDYTNTISLDAANNVIVGGSYANKSTQCDYTPYDIYVAKLNNAGAIQWEKRYARSPLSCGDAHAVNDIATDASNNVFILGSYNGTFSFGNGSGFTISSVNGSGDVFLARLNSSGACQWVRSAGGISAEGAASLYTDASGNSYIGGNYGAGTPAGGSATFGSITIANTDGSGDPFVAKYSASGAVLWAVNPVPSTAPFTQVGVTKVVPFNGSILINDLRMGFWTLSTTDGSVISSVPIIGNGMSPTDTNATGSFNLFDTEVAGSDYVFCMNGRCGTVSIDGTVFGASCSDCSSGCYNFGDMLLARTGSGGLLAPPVGDQLTNDIQSQGNIDRDLVVFPNPASDGIIVYRIDNLSEMVVTIYDQRGSIMHTERMDSGQNSIRIDLQQMIDGVYFVSTISDGIVHTKRLIIKH